MHLRRRDAFDDNVGERYFSAVLVVQAGDEDVARRLVVDVFERDPFIVGNFVALVSGVFEGLGSLD